MTGIEPLKLRLPDGEKGTVGRGGNSGALKLRQQILRSVIGETEVAGEELLIEDRRSQESCKLLFFDGIARQGEDVAQAGKNKARYAALEWLEKGELTIGEGDGHVCLTDLNAVRRGNGIGGLSFDPERVQSGESISRRFRSNSRKGEKKKAREEVAAPQHRDSVVTFGMKGQGRRENGVATP